MLEPPGMEFDQPMSDSVFRSVPEQIRDRARLHPLDVAIACEGQSRTWGDFDRAIDAISHHLRSIGVRKGDRVALLAINSIEYAEAYFAALRAGAVVVPLSTMVAGDALHRMLEDAAPKALFVSSAFRTVIESMRGGLPFCAERGLVAIDFVGPGWVPFMETSLTYYGAFHERIEADDLYNIVYSSGTTGVPKGIVHTHQMRASFPGRFSVHGFSDDSVCLVATPLYGNFSLAAFLTTLVCGGTVVLLPKFDARGFLELASQRRVTHTALVPIQFQRILDVDGFDSYDLGSFVAKFTGGAPTSVELKRAVAARWPGRFIELYGLTEGGPGASLDVTAFPEKLHTVGRPGADVRVIDEHGRELPRGGVGEIVGRWPAMMATGYYKRPDLTEQLIWRDGQGDVFHRSGDFGRLDEDGFIVLLDRKKDMIISGGLNVYAADIEAVMAGHPDVAEVAVVAMPSREWGESPFAVVVPRAGTDLAGDELMDWTNQRVGKGSRIAGVELRSELPRNPLGKVLKRQLRDELQHGRTSEVG